MAWEIIVEEPEPDPGVDFCGWVWKIQSGDDVVRRITVRVSRTAMESADEGLPVTTVAAKATKGRSVVEALLAEDAPHRVWLCNSAGCARDE